MDFQIFSAKDVHRQVVNIFLSSNPLKGSLNICFQVVTKRNAEMAEEERLQKLKEKYNQIKQAGHSRVLSENKIFAPRNGWLEFPSFPIGFRPIFRGKLLLVSGRVDSAPFGTLICCCS